MNLAEYKQKRELYQEFAHTVKKILFAAISEESTNGYYKYHLQQIQCRAKTYESLENRLREEGNENAEDIEKIRNDLAGCRIIFYFNDDVTEFTNSNLIQNNFKVHREKSKIHGYGEEILSANDCYTANHYIIELDDKRTSLPDYTRFKGLICEIQIHTVLNHAWSETAHDIIYKKPETNDFGNRMMESIDKSLLKVMMDYLKPAGYELQKIQRDYQLFLDGKTLFDQNIENKIINSKDNNERHEILERFLKSTLPLYNLDYFKNKLNTIFDVIKSALSSSINVKMVEIDTPLGPMKGKNFHDILETSLKILNFVRYMDVNLTILFLIDIYKDFSDEESRELICNSVRLITKYNIDVLENSGFLVQDIILSLLENFDDSILNQIEELIVAIAIEILEPSIEKVSSNYKYFEIKHGSVPGNDLIYSIRQRTLELLKKIYIQKEQNSDKCKIINAFDVATKTPSLIDYSDQLLEIILKNSIEVINFYYEIIPRKDYEILESIEERVCFLYKRSKSIINSQREFNSSCIEQCNFLIESAIRFRDELNDNQEFFIYKILVGYESVFYESWDNDKWDTNDKINYRETKAEEFSSSIDDKNKDFWKQVIIKCAQTKSKDLATFLIFCKFLNSLSQKKPKFIFDNIIDLEDILSNFLTPILVGLMRSNQHKRAISFMFELVRDGKYLYECANTFKQYKPLNEKLIKEIFQKAKEKSDYYALIAVLIAIEVNYDPNDLHLVDELFFPSIQELTKLCNTNWVFAFSRLFEHVNILDKIKEEGVDIILNNLLFLKEIEYHAERILNPIAQEFPDKILLFFKNRLDFKKENNNIIDSYSPIPFGFQFLQETLSKNPKLIVSMVSAWYENYTQFSYQEAILLHNIFPVYSEEFENVLIDLIHTKDEKNILIVMGVLQNYNGNPVINNTCKEIIKSLPQDSHLLSKVMTILGNTGVVEGDLGFVKAYKNKREEINDWLQDPDEKIKIFATKYISCLDKRIIAEIRRAEERTEMEKHIYGDEQGVDQDES
jgi:ppGpp synthetase/RelA/SpoT-type nucleotidyltranferase/6-pyruvoyl-tetrahydropterin synthase